MSNLIKVAVITKDNSSKWKRGDIVFNKVPASCDMDSREERHGNVNDVTRHYKGGWVNDKNTVATVIDLDNCKEDPTLGAFLLMVFNYRYEKYHIKLYCGAEGLNWSQSDAKNDPNFQTLVHLYKTGRLPDQEKVEVDREELERIYAKIGEKLGK
jgi:hypothetical protein